MTKEDLTQGHEKVGKKAEEELGQKLVCPHCQINYEFGSSCIQCGSALETMIPAREKDAAEIDLKRPEDKKDRFRTQESEEQPIEESRRNLICPACKVTYEHGNYCMKCGLILVPQFSTQTEEGPRILPKPEIEEKSIPLQTFQEQWDEASRKRLICPHCKIIYERGTSCVRCGTALVTQISFQEENKPEQTELTEVKKEESEFFPTSEEKTKEEPIQTQVPEDKPSKKKDEESERGFSFLKKRKRDDRRLFREIGGITVMVVAGGYFLWAIYSHLITRSPEPETATSKERISQISPRPSTSTAPALPIAETRENSSPSKDATVVALSPAASSSTPDDAVVADTIETGRMNGLLENIRQANLQKDIELFMSCYTMDFKDREGKKKSTLAFWKNFDYLDLSYNLKNPSISGNMAKARVEWLIKISPKASGQGQESKTILDITLRKEEEGWKIKEVKQP